MLNQMHSFFRQCGFCSSWRAPLISSLLLLLCFSARTAQGAPETAEAQRANPVLSEETVAAVPESLRPWIPWVMADHLELNCGAVRGASRCVWPREISLSVNGDGGSFSLQGVLFQAGALPLPGSDLVAPLEVTGKDGETMAVVALDGTPHIRLEKGPFALNGIFKWKEMPKSLRVPSDIALVSLDVQGRKIDNPQIGEKGEVWLVDRSDSSVAEQDAAHASVFRKLEDGVPFRIETAVQLRISGKVRELVLGDVLPPQSTLVGVQSDLAVRVDSLRGVVVQVRPGRYSLRFENLLPSPPANLSVPEWQIPGFSGEEVWVWKPNEEVRSVRISGGILIDSSRTELPGEWKGLTTTALSKGQAMAFEEVRRGEVDAGTNTLSLVRTLWLPLDGDKLLVRDNISGLVNRDWRLDAIPELEVGRASIGGIDQLITKAPSGEGVGLEVRQQNLSLLAESKLSATLGKLPVVSWNHPMESVSLTVNLPPGWEVLHATGADSVSASWVGSWSLLDVFLVLLVSIATAKLVGGLAGATVFVGLGLLHGQAGSPQLIYFHLLGAFALVRFLPESNFKHFVRFHYAATLMLFAVLVVSFSFYHLIRAIYPSVLPPGGNLYGFLEPFFYLVEGTFSGWIMFTLLVWGAQLFFTGSFFSGLLYGVAGVALMMVVGASASFTGVSGDEYGRQRLGAVVSGSMYAMESMSMDNSAESAPMARGLAKNAFKALQTFDPNSVVQTGPGMPEWNWRSVSLTWSGRVEPGYQASIFALGPNGFLVVSFVRVFVLVFLLWVFLQRSTAQWWKSLALRNTALGVACLFGTLLSAVVTSPQSVNAEPFPSDVLLKQLEQRLTKDLCQRDCTSINSMQIAVNGDRVRGELRVSSVGVGAAALPGPLRSLAIESVTLNGEPLRALRRESDGSLWARVPSGEHGIQFTGKLSSREVATIQFPLNPQHVTVSAPDFLVDGVSPTGSVRESLQLTRKIPTQNAEKGETESDIEVSSWFQVSRSLAIGLPWELTTRIQRLGSKERPEILSLKLLEGESVVSPGFNVKDLEIEVQFPRGVAELEWNSTLKPAEQLKLVANSQARISEDWEVRCSTLWSCKVQGLAPERSVLSGTSGWLFRPYPGDRLSIDVERPLGASGQSRTVERVRHHITPGVRSLKGSLTLNMRASQGTTQSVNLPDGVTLQRVLVDQRDETTRFSGTQLQIPVSPGASIIQVDYVVAEEQGISLKVPAVSIDGTAANVSTVVSAPQDRWLLLTFGTGFGPAVLFWAKLLVVILAAIVLGRMGIAPMSTQSWILLGLGLATLPIPLMLVPVLWFWLLSWREKAEISSTFRFNVVQVALGILTMVVLMLLYRAVETGLILSPDMFVRGQNTYASELTWYIDYSSDTLPQPMIISVPMWVWRAVMLAWSMWLVFAMLRWLRWAFGCLSVGGLWRASAPKVAGASTVTPASNEPGPSS